MDNRPIGVFDSGMGGLTAVRQLLKLLPGEDIVYFGDTGRVPYGGRSASTIIRYARQDVAFLRTFDLKAIVIACGTVSTTALSLLERENPIPLLGVVEPAAKAAVKATRSGRIGIVGTKATVRSGAYEAAIRQRMERASLTALACPLLVPLVEEGRVHPGDPVVERVVEEYFQPLKAEAVDTVVLGCTHYPLLKKMIGDFMGDEVHLVDSGKVTAQAAAAALDDLGLLNGKKAGGTARYFVSDTPDNFDELAHTFLGEYAGGTVERIAIETY